MKTTTFTEACDHLNDVLGIRFGDRVTFSRSSTLKNFSVLGSLVMAYRYAEATGMNLVVHDMTTGGHKSHQLGTELDFDVASKRRDPLLQIHVVADLLRIRDALRPHLTAFRLGFYFDQLNDPLAEEADTFEKFKKTYGSISTAASMHLGVRHRWKSDEYKGNPMGADQLDFGIWGRGSRTFGRSDRWTKRLLSWPVGHLNAGCSRLANQVLLDDYRKLDRYPNGYASTLVDNSSGCRLYY